MKTYGRVDVHIHLFLASVLLSGQIQTQAALPAGYLRYPLERKVGGSKNSCGWRGGGGRILPLPGQTNKLYGAKHCTRGHCPGPKIFRSFHNKFIFAVKGC
jgi:hypothetical protein